MTYQEKIEILSGTMYDYDDYCDSCPDYCDYDEPGDWDDDYGFVGLVECDMRGGSPEMEVDFDVGYGFISDKMCCGPPRQGGTGADTRLTSFRQDSRVDPGT